MKYSFVIPCYNSESTISLVVDEIKSVMSAQSEPSYEIILVNDFSKDHTRDVIFSLADQNDHITAISLAKNAGQDNACLAGYRASSGDFVVSLDDDGQNPVDELHLMKAKLDEGFDVVIASYPNKQHSSFRNFGSKMNDRMETEFLGKPEDLYIGSYFIARRFVIDQITKYENPYPYIRGLLLSATGKIANVPVHHRKRITGSSQYTFKKLMNLMLNGFTSFSVKPLRIATIFGAIVAFFGFIMMISAIVQKLLNPALVDGWASLMSTITFLGGIVLLTLGLIGEYIGRIFISINKIPQYVIKETSRNNSEESR